MRICPQMDGGVSRGRERPHSPAPAGSSLQPMSRPARALATITRSTRTRCAHMTRRRWAPVVDERVPRRVPAAERGEEESSFPPAEVVQKEHLDNPVFSKFFFLEFTQQAHTVTLRPGFDDGAAPSRGGGYALREPRGAPRAPHGGHPPVCVLPLSDAAAPRSSVPARTRPARLQESAYWLSPRARCSCRSTGCSPGTRWRAASPRCGLSGMTDASAAAASSGTAHGARARGRDADDAALSLDTPPACAPLTLWTRPACPAAILHPARTSIRGWVSAPPPKPQRAGARVCEADDERMRSAAYMSERLHGTCTPWPPPPARTPCSNAIMRCAWIFTCVSRRADHFLSKGKHAGHHPRLARGDDPMLSRTVGLAQLRDSVPCLCVCLVCIL